MKKAFWLLAAFSTLFGQVLSVHDIQFSETGPSPYADETVQVEGVVVAKDYSGDKFFIADEIGGLWSGIYVYDFDTTRVFNVGSHVRMTAQVYEYYDFTELKNLTSFEVLGAGMLPAPYHTTCTEAASSEALEGVLVQIENVVVSEDGTTSWQIADHAGNTLLVKRGFDYDLDVFLGDTISSITGIMVYDWGEYKIEPRSNDDIVITHAPVETVITTIAEIQANPAAFSAVTIEGVVTVPAGTIHGTQLKAYVQDASGRGIMLYKSTISETERTELVRGARIRVTGTVTEYSGTTEITSFTYTVLGTASLPTPVDAFTIFAELLDYEGTWMRLAGHVTDIYETGASSGNYNITVENGSQSAVVRIWATTGISPAALEVGDSVVVYGAGSVYSSAFQLVPAVPADFNIATGIEETPEVDSTLTPIADIQANPSAFDTVTIEGVVTVPVGTIHGTQFKAYVQDNSGKGINIYKSSFTSTDQTAFTRGNRVRITGRVTEYSGITEITSFSYEVIGTGLLPTATNVVSVYSTATAYEGTWMTLSGRVSDAYSTGGSDYNVLVSAGGNSVTVRIWGTTGIDGSSVSAGDSVTIFGVGSIYSSAFQLVPAMSEDIIIDTNTTPIDTTTDSTLTPIADIQANPSAFSTVTIEGVVTVPVGALHATQFKAYVQDASGKGINIYKSSFTSADQTAFTRGARVRVTGTVAEYSGVTEITSFTYETVGTSPMPTPLSVSSIWSTATTYEGTWLYVSGTISDIYNTGGSDYTATISAGGNSVPIRIWGTTGIDASTLSIGQTVRMEGVGNVYSSSFQLLPAMPVDITTDTTVAPSDSTTPIADIQANPSSFSRVTIEGVVTVPVGALHTTQFKAYVQDNSGMGINVYKSSFTAADETAFIRGAKVRIEGTVTEYSGTTEITSFTYTVLGTDTMPTPLNYASLSAPTNYEGTWMEMGGVVAEVYGSSDINLNIFVGGTATVTARVWSSTGIDLSGIEVGDSVVVRGVGGVYSSSFQLLPALQEDIDTITRQQTDSLILSVPEAVLVPTLGEQLPITYGASSGSAGTLRLYDRAGVLRATLFEGTVIGVNTLNWDGTDETKSRVNCGAYLLHFSTVDANGKTKSKTATVVVGAKLN